MINLPDVVTELQSTKGILAFILEGLKDDERVDIIQDRTLPVVREDDAKYTRRIDLLAKAIEAISNLISDGHPNPITNQVDLDIYRDLQLQYEQMGAALAIYSPKPEAEKLTINPSGPPEPKAVG